MSKHRQVEVTSEIWVKGYVDEDGDILISLGNDCYHRVLKDYVYLGIVDLKEF